jgi:Cd2+/Zn2+-exporting ATPase/Cu+-exporting ATPase
VRSTISVVIVAGACGIAAGTPLAILGAIGRATRQGAIVKGGLYLEALAAMDTVLLDKTGTLTFGAPQIREVISNDGFPTKEIIAAARIAERRSEHPLATAIVARAAELGIPIAEPDSFLYTPGRGIRVTYQGDEILVGSRAFLLDRGGVESLPVESYSRGSASEVFVTRQGKLLGSICIADVLRPEAKTAVAALREMGLKTILLSGDTQGVTTAVGHDLGVDEAVGELFAGAESKMDARTARKESKCRDGG